MLDLYRRFRDWLNSPIVRGVSYTLCVASGTLAASLPPDSGASKAAAAVAGFCGALGLSAKPTPRQVDNAAVPKR